jgi:hypothetical protein
MVRHIAVETSSGDDFGIVTTASLVLEAHALDGMVRAHEYSPPVYIHGMSPLSAVVDDPSEENLAVKVCLMLNTNPGMDNLAMDNPWMNNSRDWPYFLLLSESRGDSKIFSRVGIVAAHPVYGLEAFLDTPKQSFVVI